MLQDSATPKMVRNVINGTTPPKKIVGSYEQLEDGTYNLVIGLTGDAPSAAAITQINGEDLAGKEFYDYVRTEGAVLFSFNPDFSPAARYGGSWERITDRFIVGAGGSYALGSTGGSATHSHGAGDYLAECGQDSDGNGIYIRFNLKSGQTRYQSTQTTLPNATGAIAAGPSKQTETSQGVVVSGESSPTTVIPPYIAVNIWRRVA